MIEMRRAQHTKAFRVFRERNCGKNGEQKSNLSEEEQEGLKTLAKRIKEGEIVIMKTDKSGKFCVATREKYIELGMDHIKNDREISRDELRLMERHLNGHTAAWCIMFSTGEYHDHTSRIIKSKTTYSNNIANLYLMYKDHKIAIDKTRPVATATTSNTTGLSNAVSDFLEACANSVRDPFEVISTEDMLHKTKQHNQYVEDMKEEWKKKLNRKLNCKICNFVKIRCRGCKGALEALTPDIQEEINLQDRNQEGEITRDLEASMPAKRGDDTPTDMVPIVEEITCISTRPDDEILPKDNFSDRGGDKKYWEKLEENRDLEACKPADQPGTGVSCDEISKVAVERRADLKAKMPRLLVTDNTENMTEDVSQPASKVAVVRRAGRLSQPASKVAVVRRAMKGQQ